MNGNNDVNLTALSLSAIVFYLATAFCRPFLLTRAVITPKPLLFLLGFLAIGLHALILYQQMVIPSGLNLGFFNAASLIAWVIALLLLFTLLQQPVENLIMVLFPVAALALGLSSYFPSQRIIVQDWGVTLHIITSILAYSLFSISALQALFLAFQEYKLHHQRPGWLIYRLPPLQVMETLLFQIIYFGFFVLTVSLVTGIIFLEDIWAQHLVHKTVLSLLAWLIFAILLWGHWRYGWRGQKAIRWTLGGFLALMLAYFGSKMVLELILNRY